MTYILVQFDVAGLALQEVDTAGDVVRYCNVADGTTLFAEPPVDDGCAVVSVDQHPAWGV